MKFSFRHTTVACYIGYITQAIVNNLSPLLFLTFQRQLGISLDKIALLITVNFCVQIGVDFLSTFFLDRVGYRRAVVAAHFFSAVGLFCLGTLPFLLPNAFVAILISTVTMAIGGGMIEVIISPIMEAMPNEAKSSSMALLHSFYCWGQCGVVLLATLYFVLFDVTAWRYLPIFIALLPFLNAFAFCAVPINTLTAVGEGTPLRSLFCRKLFWVFLLLMLCAGASELGVSQWSSYFAEAGLHVSKTVGDLLGPCLFAVLMGIGRVLFGIFGERLNLALCLSVSGLGCVLSYLLTVFSPIPWLSLVGCALSGFFVALMWPGLYSLGAVHFPKAGTAMFALFAFAGDLGCSSGPALIGLLTDGYLDGKFGFMGALFSGGAESIGLRGGILFAAIFPLLMCLGTLPIYLKSRKEKKK
ncbi:MAG: MFS transporter [Clostridia bacterium]|nr:MFS transporter [Clostridia bacterium]